jgi:hypothetical protein
MAGPSHGAQELRIELYEKGISDEGEMGATAIHPITARATMYAQKRIQELPSNVVLGTQQIRSF